MENLQVKLKGITNYLEELSRKKTLNNEKGDRKIPDICLHAAANFWDIRKFDTKYGLLKNI